MKKSEAQVAKSRQPIGETLAAPVRLTPDQLEIVAAGFKSRLSIGTGPTTTSGLIYQPPKDIFTAISVAKAQ
jgi:hypothetical protein